MHKSRRITVNLERAPSLSLSLSLIPLFWTRGACVYRFLSPRTGLLMRHDGVDFTDHPYSHPLEGKERKSKDLSLSFSPPLSRGTMRRCTAFVALECIGVSTRGAHCLHAFPSV